MQKIARTKAQLAREIGVSANTVNAWSGKSDFPARGRHGWDVAKVKRWREETRPTVASELVAEERREKIETLKVRRKILTGDYVTREEVANDLGAMVGTLKQELRKCSTALASRIVGMTVAQAKVEIEKEHDRILLAVSTGKWADPENLCPKCQKAKTV